MCIPTVIGGPNPDAAAPAPTEPRAKAKCKAKAKAKSGAGGKGVSEATAKTLDELKAEISAILSFSIPQYIFSGCMLSGFRFWFQLDPALWGSSLKKEMNAVSNTSLELPQNNGLRKVLGNFKTRFEEAIDEWLG